MAHIIFVDDESEICDEIASSLRHMGHDVRTAASLAGCRTHWLQRQADILIVDRMLPDGDGLELVSQLREKGERCGILVFTAKDASIDRIHGYAAGADHYLTKPVRIEELKAVLETMVWRLSLQAEWLYNPDTHILKTPTKDQIRFTNTEATIFKSLVESVGFVVNRNTIVLHLGKNPDAYDDRNLDVMIMRIKKKIQANSASPLTIKTVHGVGYCIPHNVAFSQV
jgi:DNA-binding response OmpR family regulator